MGHVYRAYDHHLKSDVVIKFPIPANPRVDLKDFLERFDREVRSLVRLTHPHIVKVIDLGQQDGAPFVVLQYLPGGSLKSRIESGDLDEPEPMPPESLHDWLLDVAKALDFIHAQNFIHRDVKPGNILFDAFGHAFLTDFGIVKVLAAAGDEFANNSQTAPGFLLGTPNYIAPELVMGQPYDGRVDQYSLAMTVHEALTGCSFMTGPTPSATMVNQTRLEAPELRELVPTVPRRLSDAVRRGLAKNPRDRFESCTALAWEILAELPASSPSASGVDAPASATVWDPGLVPCPACRGPIPVSHEREGERIRCKRCQAVALVQVLTTGTVQLRLVVPPSQTWSGAHPESSRKTTPSAPVLLEPANPTQDFGLRTTLRTFVPPESDAKPPAKDRLRATAGRWLAVGATLLVLAAAGWVVGRGFWVAGSNAPRHLAAKPAAPAGGPGSPADAGAGAAAVLAPALPEAKPQTIEINIAYGTEKKKWLLTAIEKFHGTLGERPITINPIGLGSVEGAHAILDGPDPTPIHVWSPASSAYRDVFESEWRIKHEKSPIVEEANLALTPMVFVMWKERHEAFVKKYKEVSFETIGRAMREPGGWATIADKPTWGFFKFGHTHPNKSNSGLLTLVLMAYEFTGKVSNLSLADITQPAFQSWLQAFERGVSRPGGSLTHSTGTLMEEMVLRGPSQYDCLVVYENLAIDYMAAAQQRWGELHVVYPARSIWNEHPYYILDVPWSDVDHREAARHVPQVPHERADPARRPGPWFPPRRPLHPRQVPREPARQERKIRADDRSPDDVLPAQGRGVEEPPRLVPPDRALTA